MNPHPSRTFGLCNLKHRDVRINARKKTGFKTLRCMSLRLTIPDGFGFERLTQDNGNSHGRTSTIVELFAHREMLKL